MDQKELRELEYRCIQECAPWCVAACPVHVDVRGMCAALASEDFGSAAKILRKSVPFPGIISRICDHPCQEVCKRREAGAPIAIRALEKAALTWAPASDEKVPVLPRKNKRVAVVGAGLSGLTTALDLTKKGYEVVVLEATDRLGGAVWDYAEHELPRDVIARDLEIIKKLPMDVRFATTAGKDFSITELLRDFLAVYLGSGCASVEHIGLSLNSDGLLSADPVTFQTGEAGVFAGGSLVTGGRRRSPIGSVSAGRRAAISIDRFLQKVSLTASRENEGSYDTRLFTSTAGVEPLQQVVSTDPRQGYSTGQAAWEAGRCLQCECMECVKVCEFLEHFKGYPKKYIRQVYNNLSIVMGQRHGNKLINSCSICGLCKEVCPEGLHMGLVCKAARGTMVEQGKMPPSAHEFALRDMEFATSQYCTLARHEPGTETSAFLFFPGCQLSASSPDNVIKTYEHLRSRLRGGVGLMLGCCGAPAEWSGQSDLFSRTFSDFHSQWTQLGSPTVILACSTCHSIFRERIDEDKMVSVWETIEKVGLPEGAKTVQEAVVAIHDPCTSRHEPQVQASVRRLLQKLGVEIRELPLSRERTECCSFGGLMYFANRDLAERVIQRRIDTTPENMLAYCAMCRDRFASRGKPTWHLLDLLFGKTEIETASQKGPDYSQRRENRARLKSSLLSQLWGEESVKREKRQEMKLKIAADVRELMEKRMILVEDIQRVIQWTEETGNRLVHRETGHYLVHYRPATVTYWVEYSPSEDGYTIHNAYSHRMEVMEEIKR